MEESNNGFLIYAWSFARGSTHFSFLSIKNFPALQAVIVLKHHFTKMNPVQMVI